MLAFLLAKPTQFDAPFFRWLQAHKQEMGFVVFYWQPCGMTDGKGYSAGTDKEMGSNLSWGMDLLAGYTWIQAQSADPAGFVSLLRQYGVRYMVCNGWKGGFAPLIKAARQAGITMGLRIDSVVWGKTGIEMTLRRFYFKKMYEPFTHFFSSGTVGDVYLEAIGIAESRWKRWPYCVDQAFFSPTPLCLQKALRLRDQYKISSGPIVLAVCKWVPRENPLELLHAFIRLNPTGVQLVMIGDGPLRAEMESLKATAPQLSIHFPGYVPYGELPAWYSMAKVFVHPARNEPWGVSLQEAMASGIALVASSRVGSGFNLIRNGENGFQYPSGDADALKQSLQMALQLPASQVSLANQQVLSQWNYEVFSKEFEGLTGV